MKKFILGAGAVLGFSPLLVSAVGIAGETAPASAGTILGTIGLFLSAAIPVLITLAVVYFIWGVIQYTVSTDEEAKKGARGKIISGLIGLFVILAFWGIISVITRTFNVGPESLQGTDLPCVPNPGLGIVC